MATFNNSESGSSVRTKINNVLQHMDGTSGEVVVNDAGADVDFRVESDTVTNALFVQGSSGNVGIGTSSPSSALDVVGNIEVSGGVYLGGTAAANLLDDYEEGTWTPTLVGSTTPGTYTITSPDAYYTKVGRLVTVSASMTIAFAGGAGGTGVAVFGGLPFSKAGSRAGGGAARTFNINTPTNGLYPTVEFNTSGTTTNFVLAYSQDSGLPINLDVTGIGSGQVIAIRLIYEVI